MIGQIPSWGRFFLVLELTNNKECREMPIFARQKPVIFGFVQSAGTSPKIGNARFRSVLGACGMHGWVGAGRRRRCGRVEGRVLRAAMQAFGRRTRHKAAPARRNVARFAVLRAPGRVRQAQCAGLVPAGWPIDTVLNGAGQGRPCARSSAPKWNKWRGERL